MPQSGYPFRLASRIDYRLSAGGLTVTTTVSNESPRTAPFGLGFHPYLAVDDGLVDELELTLPVETRLLLERGIPVGSEPVAGTALDFRAGRRIGGAVLDDAFTDVQRGAGELARVSVSGTRPVGRSGLRLPAGIHRRHALPGCPPARAAVEPMTCPPNALATGEGLIRLEPGASVALDWGIEPA